MTHPILTEHPAYHEHQRRVAELEAKRHAWSERRSAQSAEYEAAVKAWRIARREGSGVPPPEPPPEDQSGSWFHEQHRSLTADGKELLADIAEDIEAAAAAREAELLAIVHTVRQQLRPVAHEITQLSRMLAQVRVQRHVAAGISPNTRPRTRDKVTPAELVELVEADERPLAPLPPLREGILK